MSINNQLRQPYLRVQRAFPADPQALSVELSRSYVDIANAVNTRTIGSFSKGFSSTTGNVWYVSGSNRKQQTLRQVYTFTTAGNILHGINTSEIGGFVSIYGTVQDNLDNWYPLPLVSTVNANAQISIQVTPTEIVITAGVAAITIAQGFVVLEWLSFI